MKTTPGAPGEPELLLVCPVLLCHEQSPASTAPGALPGLCTPPTLPGISLKRKKKKKNSLKVLIQICSSERFAALPLVTCVLPGWEGAVGLPQIAARRALSIPEPSCSCPLCPLVPSVPALQKNPRAWNLCGEGAAGWGC